MLDVAALLVLQGPGFGSHLDRLSFPSDGCKAFTVLAPGSCSKQSPRSWYPPSLPVMTEPMGAGLTCLQIALARPGRLTPKDAAGWWGLPAEIFCATVSATPTVELVACREQLCSRFSKAQYSPSWFPGAGRDTPLSNFYQWQIRSGASGCNRGESKLLLLQRRAERLGVGRAPCF